MYAGPERVDTHADSSQQKVASNRNSAETSTAVVDPAPSNEVQVADARPTKMDAVEMVPGGAVAAAASIQAAPAGLPESNEHEAFAKRDPLGFLRFCWDNYKFNVQDYRCTFTKQERIAGEHKPEQIADVRFRESPFSVDMTFTKNIGECARALYVANKWLDDEGNQQAWAKPGGAIVRLLISKILQPIHGSRAQKASRRTIDQFGFGKSFELIIHYSVKAQAEDALTLRYVGEGTIDGRSTYQFERILPYDGDESNYPDHLLVFHVDRETLLPVACYAYSDEAGNDLLGSYIYTDVVLNPGYTPEDFDPDIINF
ncbi:MAG: hypothetical protein DHS20C16_24520 [Phycisphaerae bacterium]|nr:MAG: hypothetical protein DHS20C16_24520 [Phycisphaerae bacterium]